MFVNCSYIVSFVVKSPSGGKNPWKTAPANPRRSLFENCFKSCFDTARWWGMSCAFDFLRNYWFRCFLRRVMVIFRQQKNFGPNVIYSVLGTLYRLYIVQSDPLRCWWGIPLRLLVGESLTVGDPLRCWWRNPLRKNSVNLIPIPRCKQSCFLFGA